MAIDERHIQQIMEEAHDYFTEADKRERAADDRAKQVAEAHRRGWEQVARAVDAGFRMLADAVRDTRR